MNLRRSFIILSMAVSFLPLLNAGRAQTWTQTSAPDLNWHAVASSADGIRLVAVAGAFPAGGIYISTNSGLTWTLTSAPITNWYSVASAADGTRLVATVNSERPIYISADWGDTWTETTNELPAYYYSSVASSADGTRLFVGIYDGVHHSGGMVASMDGGATWTDLGLPAVSIASSADGTKLLVGAGPVGLGTAYASFATSTNSGASWTETGVPSFGWNAVASSADGTKLVAVNADDSGFVYTSSDAGATWVTNNVAPGRSWISVASSADGTRLIAAQGGCFNPGGPGCGGPVYTSSDSGVTWVSNNVPDAFAVACSADGGRLIAVVNGGGIWTSQSTPAPSLNIKQADSNAVLSWAVPSMDFVLQENSDVATTNWTDVTNPPVLDLTNLQYEVTMPSNGGDRFYRLKH